MSTINRRPQWHFRYIAPIYDFVSLTPDVSLIRGLLELNPGDKFIDVGGGTGELIHEVQTSSAPSPLQCYIVDMSTAMLKQAQSKKLTNLIAGDSRNLPIRKNSFDAVFLGEALHHMASPTRVLKNIKTVLRPGGRLVIEETDPGRCIGKLIWTLEYLLGAQSKYFSPESLKQMLREKNFMPQSLHRRKYKYFLKATLNEP